MRFLEIPANEHRYDNSRFVIVPVPYEATTSYGRGTKNGPVAILKASQQVEDFDCELGFSPLERSGVFTQRPVVNIKHLASSIQTILKEGKIPIVLGGEHSLTVPAVRAAKDKYPNLSVLQLDAHADLRDSYRGRRDSHACVMRRVLEICPAVQVGIRSMSEEEHLFAKQSGQLSRISYATSNLKLQTSKQNSIEQLSSHVYLSIDVDVFDPSVVPAVGTPEPGGLNWLEVQDLLKDLCAKKNVVGVDVVELSPRRGDLVSDYTVAKLVYKIIGLLSQNS